MAALLPSSHRQRAEVLRRRQPRRAGVVGAYGLERDPPEKDSMEPLTVRSERPVVGLGRVEGVGATSRGAVEALCSTLRTLASLPFPRQTASAR